MSELFLNVRLHDWHYRMQIFVTGKEAFVRCCEVHVSAIVVLTVSVVRSSDVDVNCTRHLSILRKELTRDLFLLDAEEQAARWNFRRTSKRCPTLLFLVFVAATQTGWQCPVNYLKTSGAGLTLLS